MSGRAVHPWRAIRPSHERTVLGFDAYVQDRLLEQRIVLAQGMLDRERATSVAAQLLTLEAWAHEPIVLRMACHGGELDAVLGLVDAIGALGVELRAVAAGEVSGAAVAAYAAAPVREASPHARFGLREPEAPPIDGPASRIAGLAEEHLARHDTFVNVLAEATGRRAVTVAADLRQGRFLTADEAADYGLVTVCSA